MGRCEENTVSERFYIVVSCSLQNNFALVVLFHASDNMMEHAYCKQFLNKPFLELFIPFLFILACGWLILSFKPHDEKW